MTTLVVLNLTVQFLLNFCNKSKVNYDNYPQYYIQQNKLSKHHRSVKSTLQSTSVATPSKVAMLAVVKKPCYSSTSALCCRSSLTNEPTRRFAVGVPRRVSESRPFQARGNDTSQRRKKKGSRTGSPEEKRAWKKRVSKGSLKRGSQRR